MNLSPPRWFSVWDGISPKTSKFVTWLWTSEELAALVVGRTAFIELPDPHVFEPPGHRWRAVRHKAGFSEPAPTASAAQFYGWVWIDNNGAFYMNSGSPAMSVYRGGKWQED